MSKESAENIPWLQGALVDRSAISALIRAGHLPSDWFEDDVVLVVSHSCDLVSADFEAEPFAEVLRADIIAEVNGNFAHGKNPREYHVSTVLGGEPVAIALRVRNRCYVDRQALLSTEPREVLDPQLVRGIARWLGKRYWREAFPDAFNARVQRVLPKVRRSLGKSGGRLLAGIYLQLSPQGEATEGQPYVIGIIGAMRDPDYTVTELRDACQRTLDRITQLFGSVDGVDVEESELLSEADISLDDLRYYQRWDSADDLSLRTVEAAIVPEVG